MVVVAHLAPVQEVALAEAVLKVCEALHLLVGTALKAKVFLAWVLVLCLVRWVAASVVLLQATATILFLLLESAPSLEEMALLRTARSLAKPLRWTRGLAVLLSNRPLTTANITCLEWLARVSPCPVLAETSRLSTKDSLVEVNLSLRQAFTQSRKLSQVTSTKHILTPYTEHTCNQELAGTHLLFPDTLPHQQLR